MPRKSRAMTYCFTAINPPGPAGATINTGINDDGTLVGTVFAGIIQTAFVARPN